MRAIACVLCGVVKATPPDDAARKLFPRYVRGFTRYDMCCDYCGNTLHEGEPAVALTVPDDWMPGWEDGYLIRRDALCECGEEAGAHHLGGVEHKFKKAGPLR